MNIWNDILDTLEQGKKLVLLLVVENRGSSPGRQGFKMLVNEDGTRSGSIGGGATEHKLVSRANKMLSENIMQAELHEQIHRTDEAMHSSGMICSGENTVIVYPLHSIHTKIIKEIKNSFENGKEISLTISITEFGIKKGAEIKGQYDFSNNSIYKEVVGFKHIICIIGGGHVGLALSKQMKILHYYVKVYDNRQNLDTLEANNAADEKHIVKYDEIDKYVPEGDNVYIVIASFSHTHDKNILKKLLNKKVPYIGMMGSKNKVKEIFGDLISKGYSEEQLNKVSAPIGVTIKSETPPEIAVSIAAEIIDVRNMKKY